MRLLDISTVEPAIRERALIASGPPGVQGLMEQRVTILVPVKDRSDVLRTPFRGALRLFAARVVAKRKDLDGRLAKQPVGSKRVHHVAHDGIVDAITNKADGVIAKEFADKARRPAFGQVGKTEITAGDD